MQIVIFRCDKETKLRVSAHAKKIGSTMSEIVRRAIAKYLKGKK